MYRDHVEDIQQLLRRMDYIEEMVQEMVEETENLLMVGRGEQAMREAGMLQSGQTYGDWIESMECKENLADMERQTTEEFKE